MKIAQVTIRFLPSVGGGVQHVKYLSESLRNRSHEVDIYTSYLIDDIHDVQLPSKESYLNGIEIYRYKWLKTFPGRDTTYLAPKLFLDMLARNYDIIHVHGFRYFPVYGGSMFSFISKAPLVATFHHNPQVSRNFLQKIYDSTLLKYLANRIAKIIALTNYEKKWLLLHGIRQDKVSVVPNGLPSSFFKEIDEIKSDEVYEFLKKYKLTDKTRLLFIGRIDPVKNLEIIIKALYFLPSNISVK